MGDALHLEPLMPCILRQRHRVLPPIQSGRPLPGAVPQAVQLRGGAVQCVRAFGCGTVGFKAGLAHLEAQVLDGRVAVQGQVHDIAVQFVSIQLWLLGKMNCWPAQCEE